MAIAKQKNHSFLLKVFSEIIKIKENAFLIIIGDGKLENNLKTEAAQLNIDDKLSTDRSVLSEISNAKNEMLEPVQYCVKYQADFRKSKIGEIYKWLR